MEGTLVLPPTMPPIPDAKGIYGYPTALQSAHRAHLQHLQDQPGALALRAPLTGALFPIAARTPSGRPVLVFEPHHDDFVLSASGRFLAEPRPLTVATAFTRSHSVHPTLEASYPTIEHVSALRAREAEESLRPFETGRIQLGHKDADPPYLPYDWRLLDRVTEQLAEIRDQHPDAELLAPAAVTRHPDHLLIHEAARRLGCSWFWEDLAFWPTYALATDDCYLFEQRTGDALMREPFDITEHVLDKLTLLIMHGSQMQPPSAMYRPIRHAWSAAAPLRLREPGALYAERFFRMAAS